MVSLEGLARAALNREALALRSLAQDLLHERPAIREWPRPETSDPRVLAVAAGLAELLALRLGQEPPGGRREWAGSPSPSSWSRPPSECLGCGGSARTNPHPRCAIGVFWPRPTFWNSPDQGLPPRLGRHGGSRQEVAHEVVSNREQYGAFDACEELRSVRGLVDGTFEQCAGFLRVRGGRDPLDLVRAWDVIEVEVLGIDPGRQRVSPSRKRTLR